MIGRRTPAILSRLLAEDQNLIFEGRFAEFISATERRLREMEKLSKRGEGLVRADVEQLIAVVQKSQKLLEASRAGMRSVVAARNAPSPEITTYSAQGNRQKLVKKSNKTATKA